MATRRQDSKAERDLSERQRYWLKHLRKAEQKGEPVKSYAKRLGLSESSLYEAKRRLRACGVMAPAPQRRVSSAGFARVAVVDSGRAARSSFRVRLASGALLEWREAPEGNALRELIGLIS